MTTKSLPRSGRGSMLGCVGLLGLFVATGLPVDAETAESFAAEPVTTQPATNPLPVYRRRWSERRVDKRSASTSGSSVEKRSEATVAVTHPQAEAPPAGHSVLILIDPGAASSQQWLGELEASGYRGYGATVLVLDRSSPATANPPEPASHPAPPDEPSILQLQRRLPEATWRVSQAAVLGELQVAGTPQLIGLDSEGQPRWRQSPHRGDSEQLTLRLLDWVLGPHARRAAPRTERR